MIRRQFRKSNCGAKQMEYKTLAYVNKPVSKIVFGCAMPLMLRGDDATKFLDAAFEFCITAFDTAENYGLSEVSLGNWIEKRKIRDEVVITLLLNA